MDKQTKIKLDEALYDVESIFMQNFSSLYIVDISLLNRIKEYRILISEEITKD